MSAAVSVRGAVDGDDVCGWVRRSWGDTVMAVHGRLYDVARLPSLVATSEEIVVGVLTYDIERDELEIVSCDAEPPGRRVGRALVAAAVELPRTRALRRVWCTTTNDNLAALGFWQAVGFEPVGLRPGAVGRARCLKRSIPPHGHRAFRFNSKSDVSGRTQEVSMAKGYWVSVYRAISDSERLTAYNKLAGPAVQAGGGRLLSRDGRVVAHESGMTQRVVLIEFDSFEQAVAAYESEAYQKALVALSDGVERDFRIIEGID